MVILHCRSGESDFPQGDDASHFSELSATWRDERHQKEQNTCSITNNQALGGTCGRCFAETMRTEATLHCEDDVKLQANYVASLRCCELLYIPRGKKEASGHDFLR
eukprot:TRINITY_DN13155_c0_g1_i1.p1 TRINITY_DN13155_c0_g1~~TRINITY_DN13155_c0_g1_i1.p1  ORF type:complete len:106 (+),score=12.26 TRINITY_DN13155_c0_g1_i1:866-1183(+)